MRKIQIIILIVRKNISLVLIFISYSDKNLSLVETFLEVILMPFSYNKLWKILIDKNMNKVALRD